MDNEKIKQLNKEFAVCVENITQEFIDLFQKWMEKDARTTLICAIHLPLNIIINLIEKNEMVPKVFPDLCGMLNRFLSPFEVIKDKFGKIPGKEFVKLYGEIYQDQFDEFFPSKEAKERFENWFYSTNKDKK